MSEREFSQVLQLKPASVEHPAHGWKRFFFGNLQILAAVLDMIPMQGFQPTNLFLDAETLCPDRTFRLLLQRPCDLSPAVDRPQQCVAVRR